MFSGPFLRNLRTPMQQKPAAPECNKDDQCAGGKQCFPRYSDVQNEKSTVVLKYSGEKCLRCHDLHMIIMPLPIPGWAPLSA